MVAAEHDGAPRPVAFVVAHEGADVDEDATIERCREQLASYKVPRRVLALDELPTTDGPNGRKVQRTELRRHGGCGTARHRREGARMSASTPNRAAAPPQAPAAGGA